MWSCVDSCHPNNSRTIKGFSNVVASFQKDSMYAGNPINMFNFYTKFKFLLLKHYPTPFIVYM